MAKQRRAFSPEVFLSTIGLGREMMSFRKGKSIFAQGDAVFVIQTGRVRLSARSKSGKEATHDILGDENFVGKDSIAGPPVRTTSGFIDYNLKSQQIRIRRSLLAFYCEATRRSGKCTESYDGLCR